MRYRVGALVAFGVLALAVTSSAFAFDCVRVSSSFQGLQQSTGNSGRWLLFDMTNPAVVQNALAPVAVGDLTLDDAACISEHYEAMNLPLYFALGDGVAGGFTNGSGVLAHNNPNTQGELGNLKGIDHLEASPIGFGLFTASAACGVTLAP
jgi:hypothetical protein